MQFWWYCLLNVEMSRSLNSYGGNRPETCHIDTGFITVTFDLHHIKALIKSMLLALSSSSFPLFINHFLHFVTESLHVDLACSIDLGTWSSGCLHLLRWEEDWGVALTWRVWHQTPGTFPRVLRSTDTRLMGSDRLSERKMLMNEHVSKMLQVLHWFYQRVWG